MENQVTNNNDEIEIDLGCRKSTASSNMHTGFH